MNGERAHPNESDHPGKTVIFCLQMKKPPQFPRAAFVKYEVVFTSSSPSSLCAFLQSRLARRGGRRARGTVSNSRSSIAQSDAMAELHGIRIADVFAADVELDVGTGDAAFGKSA